MAEKITDALVRNLDAPAKGYTLTFDGGHARAVRGFLVRVTAKGTKSFCLNYRHSGRERRMTIGTYPTWTVAAARERAEDLRRLVDAGQDPMAERHEQRAAPTVGDLCDRFVEEHLPKRRPSTQAEYRSMIKHNIRRPLGAKKVGEVEHEDIERLHRRLSEKAPYRANRTVAVLSKMFSLAETWQWRPQHTNPARGIERNAETKRRRYLTGDERARLLEALAAHPDQTMADAVRLLMLTGARRSEVLRAEWRQFDFETGVWNKPASATKQKLDHSVPLSAPARAILARIPRTDDRYLFPGRRAGEPVTDIKKFWAQLCKAAKIDGLRLHDLRHSYAATLAGAGFSLPMIGALLGHTQSATTARYAHLLDDPMRAATERAGAEIAGGDGGEVVDMGRRGA